MALNRISTLISAYINKTSLRHTAMNLSLNHLLLLSLRLHTNLFITTSNKQAVSRYK